MALQALETAQSQTIIVEQPKVEESAPIPPTIVEPEQQAIIEDDVVVTEEVTHANSGTCGDNLTWTLDDAGNLTISGTGEMERFNWYVDQKRPPWGTSVVNVIIQNGVTSIGDYAFQECKSLKNITLPDSITYISYNAFCSCSSLTNITIPNNVTGIEAYAFMDCSSLKTIAIPNNVTWLGEYAFGFCKSLTSITMSEGVTDIDDNAFVHCESLTSITIPSTVTYIGDNAFSWCSALARATIHGNTSIGDNAFEYCDSLKIVIMDGDVTSIGDFAFSSCSSLTSIIVSNSITSIGYSAFSGCNKLSSFIIPNNVTSIADSTFAHCNSLTSVTIPSGVVSIGNSAFVDCGSLTSVTIPDKVISIGNNAFADCDSLTSVTIPDSVTGIGDSAFSSCDSLTSVTIPYSVISIGDSAFFGCDALIDIFYQGTEDQWKKIDKYSWSIPSKTVIHYLEQNDYNNKIIRIKNGYVSMPEVFSHFSQSVYQYDHDIAKYAAGLSTLVYSDDYNLIKTGLNTLGYNYLENNYNVTVNNKSYMGEYSPVHFGLHYIDELDTTLVIAVIRGTYHEEWLTNWDIGSDYEHSSFSKAATHVYDRLYNYINNHSDQIKGTLKILVTGHSRGAATANLLSAYLDNYSLYPGKLNSISVESKNVYAYTFATPNTTARNKTIREAYPFNNIFNVVNPEDFVTKVVPSAWGYGRFGRTLVLPCATSISSKYSTYLGSVRAYYSMYDKGETYDPYPHGMFDVSKYVYDITSSVRNVNAYYNQLLGNAGTLFDLYRYALGGLLSEDSYYGSLAGSYIRKAINYEYGSVGFETITFFLKNEVLGIIDDKTIDQNWFKNYFSDAHVSETYLAMLNSISGEESYCNVQMYGIVNCPVDISVYNSEGTLVGQIINNEVQSGNKIWMYVDGDSKIYILPEGDTYRVELSGNDTGFMDYSIVSEDADTYSQVRSYHEGLQLTANKLYTTDDNSDYTILTTDENELEPTAEFDTETGKQLKVNVTVQGRGSAPSLENLTPGDYVTLKAVTDSNNEFYGWYDSKGKLVSNDTEYSFSIHDDMAFTAKFSNVFVAASSMTFDEQSVTIANQNNYYNNLTIGPENVTAQKILWTSSDESVVTVDNGVILGMHAGTATITASLEDGTLSASYTVRVLPFSDVPQDAWYFSTAMECYETGLINGTSSTTFSPMQEMTRAMVVTILWRMEGQPKVDFNNKFSDVSSKQWYATSISWAEKVGVVHGYGDGTFKPDAAVTREQVAVMLANYATYKGVYVPGTKKLNTYPDGSQVSTWAQAGMKWALTNGIVSGNGEGYLRPKKSATRAEGAAMLLRMKNWL